MFSIHFTGSPWFLLLLPPGLFIFWRQYHKGVVQGGPSFGGKFLLCLQTLALLLLTLSLTALELRRHRVEFHNPTILLLRDQSASFQNGGYLGLGQAYSQFEKTLVENYRSRKFDVRIVDFHTTAWPVKGFPQQPKFSQANSQERLGLTSLSAAVEFVDSVAIVNLQGIFLFSDGRANVDSGKASQTWTSPVFPVLFNVDSVGEVQTERVRLNTSSKSKNVEVNFTAQKVGSKSKEATLRLVQGGKTLVQHALPLVFNSENFRFTWSPDRALSEESLPIKAIIQPSLKEANFDEFNDTVQVNVFGGGSRNQLYILRPIRSLDEKGMVDILSTSDSDDVVFFNVEELASLKFSARDQIWVESHALSESSRLLSLLQTIPAKVVVYARPELESGGRPRISTLGSWKKFTPLSEIKPTQSVVNDFPDDVVRLKSLTQNAIEAPMSWGAATPLVQIVEGNNRGLLLGRINLGNGKQALFFVLPMIWNELFDPQADFSIRANINAYVDAIKSISRLEDGLLQATIPRRAYHMVPFDLHFRIPEAMLFSGQDVSEDPSNLMKSTPLSLSISSLDYAQAFPFAATENFREPDWIGLSLSQGRYRLRLLKGDSLLWNDSLEVAPIVGLELAKIGFDEAKLSEIALRSGGHVLRQAGGHSAYSNDSSQVSSRLPSLPAAQVRIEKTQNFKLYNNLPIFLALFCLLALAWFLRKKWDFD